MNRNKFAVIGLGRFGSTIARTLAEKGAEVIAIDLDEDRVENIKDDVAYAISLDSTDKKALLSQNIQEMDAVVVAIGENFESLLLTVVILSEMKVKRLIARTHSKLQTMILEKLGISEIFNPENEVGKTVAELLLNPNVKSFLALPDDYEIVEINTPKLIVNQTVIESGIREKYNLNLITIKRTFEEKVNNEIQEVEHIIGVPKPNTVLYANDTLILMGKSNEVSKFVEVNS